MKTKVVIVVSFTVLIALTLNVQLAFAHESITVGDYTIEIGWLNEPPIVDQQNAIILNVITTSDGQPVSDVSGLIVSISYGDQVKVLTLQPLGANSPGQFIAPILPTVSGQYTLLLDGALGTTSVDTQAAPEDVTPVDTLNFPIVEEKSWDSETQALIIGALIGFVPSLITLFITESIKWNQELRKRRWHEDDDKLTRKRQLDDQISKLDQKSLSARADELEAHCKRRLGLMGKQSSHMILLLAAKEPDKVNPTFNTVIKPKLALLNSYISYYSAVAKELGDDVPKLFADLIDKQAKFAQMNVIIHSKLVNNEKMNDEKKAEYRQFNIQMLKELADDFVKLLETLDTLRVQPIVDLIEEPVEQKAGKPI